MDYQTLVITGASSGVGEALTLRFAKAGRHVYALARGKDKLAALAARDPAHIHPVTVNVTDARAVAEAIRRIDAERPIDVLINNAAVYARGDFHAMDLAKVDEILDTNIKGTLYPTHAVLPRMIARRRGRIVQVNSVAGTRGIPGESVYCASKHAVVGFSESLMQEAVKHNVLVHVINPGGIDTPLWTTPPNFYPGDKTKLLKPEEVAELVEYVLAAPDRTIFKKLVFFPTGEWH